MFQSRQNGHIKESYSPTVSKENQICNELLYTKQLTAFHLLENTKQNNKKKGRKLSTADKRTSMHVSSSLMNEINTVCNNYLQDLQVTNSMAFLCSDSIPTRNKNISYAQNF